MDQMELVKPAAISIDLTTQDRNIMEINSTWVRGTLRVKLLNKFGPLFKRGTDEGFYKFLFHDHYGQIDCLIDKDENGEHHFEKLKIGKKYILDQFQTARTHGMSLIFNYSLHDFYIRNPLSIKTIKTRAGKVVVSKGIKKYSYIRMDFKEIYDIHHGTDPDCKDGSIIDVIGTVKEIGFVNYGNGFPCKEFKILNLKRNSSITALVFGDDDKMNQIRKKRTLVVFKKVKVKANEEHLRMEIHATQATQIFLIKSQKDAWILNKKYRRVFHKILKRLPEK